MGAGAPEGAIYLYILANRIELSSTLLYWRQFLFFSTLLAINNKWRNGSTRPHSLVRTRFIKRNSSEEKFTL
jgi:hypothetical protein